MPAELYDGYEPESDEASEPVVETTDEPVDVVTEPASGSVEVVSDVDLNVSVAGYEDVKLSAGSPESLSAEHAASVLALPSVSKADDYDEDPD